MGGKLKFDVTILFPFLFVKRSIPERSEVEIDVGTVLFHPCAKDREQNKAKKKIIFLILLSTLKCYLTNKVFIVC